MNKPRLIKRAQVAKTEPTKPAVVTISQTMTVVKDWLQTRQQNTKQNARAAFANLFTQAQESCTEC